MMMYNAKIRNNGKHKHKFINLKTRKMQEVQITRGKRAVGSRINRNGSLVFSKSDADAIFGNNGFAKAFVDLEGKLLYLKSYEQKEANTTKLKNRETYPSLGIKKALKMIESKFETHSIDVSFEEVEDGKFKMKEIFKREREIKKKKK